MESNDVIIEDQNMEDGEFWLPSDFFSMDDDHVSESTKSKNPTFSSSICMLSSFQRSSNLLEPSPTFQGFQSAIDTGNSWTSRSLVCPHQRMNFLVPVHNQVENLREEQTWSVPNRFYPNPFCGGSGGGHGGTGVFLPQVAVLTATESRNRHFARKRRQGKLKLPPRKMTLNQREEKNFSAKLLLRP